MPKLTEKTTLVNKIRNLKSYLKKTSKTLLVVDSNSWVTYAAILKLEDNRISVESSCTTATSKPSEDLNALLTKLRQTVAILPNHVVLISNHVIPTLLELPNDMDNPISDSQMQEFVRWEIDLVVNEQSAEISIIELLLQQGAIDIDELDACLSGLNVEHEHVSPALIQKTLLRDQIITQEQLDKCQDLRQRHHTENEDIECAWSSIKEEAIGTESLCVGIKQEFKLEWLQAFDEHHLNLQHILSPDLCCAFAISKHLVDKGQTSLLIDIGITDIRLQKLSNNKIVLQAYHTTNQRILTADKLQTLITNYLDANVISIYYQGTHPRAESLVGKLEDMLSVKIKPCIQLLQEEYELSHDDASQQALTRVIYGIQAINVSEAEALSLAINGHPPPPAIYQQKNFQFITAILVVLLSITTNEVYLNRKMSNIENENKRLTTELQNKVATNEKIETINKDVVSLEGQLSSLRKKQEELGIRNHLIESVMVKRQRFSESLLPMLGNYIPAEVILEELIEDEWYQFTVKGWALNQASIDTFNNTLSRNLGQWNMYISESPSEFDGKSKQYNFTFVIRLKEV